MSHLPIKIYEEVARVQIEAKAMGCEIVGYNYDGDHNLESLTLKDQEFPGTFEVDFGRDVAKAWFLYKDALDTPLISKGPSGIGGKYQTETFAQALRGDKRQDSLLHCFFGSMAKLGARVLRPLKSK